MRSLSATAAAFGLLAGACSAAGPSQTDGEPSAADRTAAEAELGRVTQDLGEPTCGTIAADDTFDYPSGRVGAGTPDGNYGHPECKDGFVVDVTNVPAGAQFSGGASGPRWPDPFTCLLNWGYLSIWKKDAASGGYTLLQEASSLGVWGSLPMVGTVCNAKATVKAPAAGDYRFVAASGFLFLSKTAVSVTR